MPSKKQAIGRACNYIVRGQVLKKIAQQMYDYLFFQDLIPPQIRSIAEGSAVESAGKALVSAVDLTDKFFQY
jgi:hypothetical protein